MKKYISIFILSLISFNIAQADKKADVKTPNGSPVIAWIMMRHPMRKESQWITTAVRSIPTQS